MGFTKETVTVCPWVCPSDRNLTLRAKLSSGWSSRSSSTSQCLMQKKINPNEINQIQQVLKRANAVNLSEKNRIREMMDRVENESQKVLGSGNDDCLSCAEPFGFLFFGHRPIYCFICKKKFCFKCCIDWTQIHISRSVNQEDTDSRGKKICRVCCEKRELWKRSGAWFYNGLPPFIIHAKNDGSVNETRTTKDENEEHYKEFMKKPDMSSSSDYSGSETSSSSKRLDDKKRKNKWKRKVELPLIKRLKLKKEYRGSQINGENNGNLLKVEEKKLHLSVSSLESSFDSDFDMMYYDPDCNSNLSASCERLDKHPHKKGKFGSLIFSLLYDEEKCILQVKVIKAKKLIAKDFIGSSDPYVKIHLCPGNKRSTKQKTKTVRRNLNPTFNETLVYSGIPKRDVLRKRVLLTVYDEDRIGKNDFLGQVEVPLTVLETGRPKYFDLELGPKNTTNSNESEEDARERGRALISLLYDPMDQVLQVRVPICTGLVPPRKRHQIDAHVHAVLSVIGNDKQATFAKSERRKSSKVSSNLMFADNLRLLLPPEAKKDLNRCNLNIAVWDKDGFGRDSLIGSIHFSISAKHEQLNQWCNCSELPRTVQEAWHHLLAVEDHSLSSLFSHNKK